MSGSEVSMLVRATERRTHLLQRENRGGNLKMPAAPLQGDSTIEILMILQLVSQSTSSESLPDLLDFHVACRSDFTPGKDVHACILVSFI